jgi:hypothetical protein
MPMSFSSAYAYGCALGAGLVIYWLDPPRINRNVLRQALNAESGQELLRPLSHRLHGHRGEQEAQNAGRKGSTAAVSVTTNRGYSVRSPIQLSWAAY